MKSLNENKRLLTADDLQFYHSNGYLLVENLIPVELVTQCRSRLVEYTHGSRDKKGMHFQTEPRVQRGELKVDHPGDAIRKIDRLVEEDDLFRQLATHENMLSVIQEILGLDIKMFRNAMLLKPPRVGSEKGMHQDSPYWPITPMALCSCWFPLDDASIENGCMGVLPKAHEQGAFAHKKTKDDFVMEEGCYDMEDIEFKPMKAGSGLFFHSLLPHYTAPNTSEKWRRSIALSYMNAQSKYSHEGEGPEYLHISGQSYEGCVR